MGIMENTDEIHIEIDLSDYLHPNTWWSIDAERSAFIFQQYQKEIAKVKGVLGRRAKKQRTENNEDDIMIIDDDKDLEVKVQYEWQWPEWRKGTKAVEGKLTNISAYTLNFDTMEQTNNDTFMVRKFRIVSVLLPDCGVTFSTKDFTASLMADLENAGVSFFRISVYNEMQMLHWEIDSHDEIKSISYLKVYLMHP